MVVKLSIESRSKLNGSNRNFSPCSDCDVSGTLIGKNMLMRGTTIKKSNEENFNFGS